VEGPKVKVQVQQFCHSGLREWLPEDSSIQACTGPHEEKAHLVTVTAEPSQVNVCALLFLVYFFLVLVCCYKKKCQSYKEKELS
jgi:hypothetical protein